MFDNIGGKIKTLAQVEAWVGIIGSILIGLFLIFINENYITTGFIILIIGPLGAWLSSLILYGYGELIENSSECKEYLINLYGYGELIENSNECKEYLIEINKKNNELSLIIQNSVFKALVDHEVASIEVKKEI